MGLGGEATWRDQYEWFRLADVPLQRQPRERSGRTRVAEEPAPLRAATGRRAKGGAAKRAPTSKLAQALRAELAQRPLWTPDGGERMLLCDLDNLRADARRWNVRMGVLAWLARDADHVALAGQHAAVARAQPHLGELADLARGVADGSDLADFILLAAADAVHLSTTGPLQTVVVSNDNVFAGLAEWGPLVVLSPGADALSGRLADAASRVIDLAALENG